MEHDALRHNPDLLFVEFATNDGRAAPEAIWRSMEGIVRQTWKKNPATDIVFAYTITEAMKQDYLAGTCNRAASAMEQLADHLSVRLAGSCSLKLFVRFTVSSCISIRSQGASGRERARIGLRARAVLQKLLSTESSRPQV